MNSFQKTKPTDAASNESAESAPADGGGAAVVGRCRPSRCRPTDGALVGTGHRVRLRRHSAARIRVGRTVRNVSDCGGAPLDSASLGSPSWVVRWNSRLPVTTNSPLDEDDHYTTVDSTENTEALGRPDDALAGAGSVECSVFLSRRSLVEFRGHQWIYARVHRDAAARDTESMTEATQRNRTCACVWRRVCRRSVLVSGRGIYAALRPDFFLTISTL
ncbi:hypothetical protein SAMN05216218_12115 [Halorientalis regularis]|uniref:Uncharacterized protein n=1 Tax=Halorientalis regularis TaxID=660518 RepID=A0A1G7SYH0_9EURY|nr:hypothetical protein SAMN05216218_12115 [Halorientalis regularis]